MARPRLLLFLAGALLPVPAGAQTEMLVLTRGADTIAVERLQRTPSQLHAELVDRLQRLRWSYSVTYSDSAVTKMENAIRRADADPTGPPLQQASFAFTRDSVFLVVDAGAPTERTQRLGTRAGAVPLINPSFALMELIAARLLASGRDSLHVPVFLVSGGQTLGARARRVRPDSIVLNIGAEARLAVAPDGRILGGRVPAQGLTLTRLPASDAALHVPRPNYSAPAGVPYTAEEVRVPTPMGHTLAGTLTLPTNRPGRVPAVVTITGSGPQDRDEEIPFVHGYRPFRQIADTLAYAGIAVLRMDDRGFGESGGAAGGATSEDFARDISAGVAWLRQRGEIDPDRIALVGHSEGGLIGPMVAAQDAAIRALVVMAGPSRVGREILEYQNRYALDQATSLRPDAKDSAYAETLKALDSLATRADWLGGFLRYDPRPTAARVRAPTLVLHGATDRQVTADQAEELAAAIRSGGNRAVTVRVFEDLNHLFLPDPDGNPAGYAGLPTGRMPDDVMATLVEWLVRHLR